MEYKPFVKKQFFNAVKESKTMDPALKDALMRCQHGINRTSQGVLITRFIDNLSIELTKVQAVAVKTKPYKAYHLGELKDLVYSMVEVFAQQLENKAKLAYESDLAKRKRNQEAQDIKDMDDTLAGKPSGAFEEMGIIIDEARDEVKS